MSIPAQPANEPQFLTGPDKAFLMKVLGSMPALTRKQMSDWTNGPADQFKAILAPFSLSPVAFESHELPVVTTDRFSNRDRKVQKDEIARMKDRFLQHSIEKSTDDERTVFSAVAVTPSQLGFKQKVSYPEILHQALRSGQVQTLSFVQAYEVAVRAEDFADGSTRILTGMTPFDDAVIGASFDKGKMWVPEPIDVAPPLKVPLNMPIVFAAKVIRQID